jgi:hypothetical protein
LVALLVTATSLEWLNKTEVVSPKAKPWRRHCDTGAPSAGAAPIWN